MLAIGGIKKFDQVFGKPSVACRRSDISYMLVTNSRRRPAAVSWCSSFFASSRAPARVIDIQINANQRSHFFQLLRVLLKSSQL